jgi:hypothetical protein
MNRREFLGGISATALAAFAGQGSLSQAATGRLRVLVFWDGAFPAIDGFSPVRADLAEALGAHDTRFADADGLSAALAEFPDVFVSPYGSAFPQTSWGAILKYLRNGGNLVNLGGRPFSVPVGPDRRPRTAQTNYHKRLGITQYFTIEGAADDVYVSRAEGIGDKIGPARVFEAYFKLSNRNDFPDEAGSDGPREASVAGLLHGHRRDGRFPVSAPIIEVNRLRGEFAGGRWIFANYDGAIDRKTIAALVGQAGFGAFELKARPVRAHVRTGTAPVIRIEVTAPRAGIGIVAADLSISDASGRSVWSSGRIDTVANETRITTKALLPGFYQGVARFTIRSRQGSEQSLPAPFAFWVTDGKPITNGSPFTMDRHFLFRDGEPYPVAGTTFMSTEVARRFLLEPDVAGWNHEFERMKAAGVNMIRTGIWTGWSLYLDENGDVRDEVLNAFEAFVLTAAKFDIPLIFNFFAFMPLMFGGENAYLDPRSVDGQKRFISAFASRVKAAGAIIWDLINEPSFANPKMLWSCRPNYDRFEAAAWRDWLKKRYAEADENSLGDILRDRWRLREDEDAFALPALKDFENINIHLDRRPMRVVDFRLFAQDVFSGWARALRDTLRVAGSPLQPVTVGQDEAGANDSPSTQFHAGELDLTGLHNWWANDDLLWDAVVTKHPSKANLVQETGLMFYEKQDGSAWRTDRIAADLLERKMALSLGASGAGFIQWIWSINPFMDNENEAAIGFQRLGGSFKEEFERFRAFAKFANQNRRLFRGKIDEDIVLVIPHSQQFSARNLATEATRRAVRALHYDLWQTCRAVSEYGLDAILAEEKAPLFLILPAPRTISDAAWSKLVKLAEKGSTVIASGFFEEDEHFRPAVRVGEMFGFSRSRPVNRREAGAVFSGDKLQRIERADTADDVRTQILGKGKIVWHPVPLENGDSTGPIAGFYGSALPAQLNPYLPTGADLDDVLVRVTKFESALLYTFVNETGRDRKVFRTDAGNEFEDEIEAGRANMFFVDKRTGKLLSKVY